eukprot:384095-Prymnesium_polylepis.1
MLKGEKEKAHDGEICSVDVSADGAKIVSGGSDKAIKVWDSGTLELEATKENAHSNYISSVAFNPVDGKPI